LRTKTGTSCNLLFYIKKKKPLERLKYFQKQNNLTSWHQLPPYRCTSLPSTKGKQNETHRIGPLIFWGEGNQDWVGGNPITRISQSKKHMGKSTIGSRI